MNPQELAELKKLIIYVADYYSRDMKPAVVTMMASDLEDLPFDQVKEAYNTYRRNGKNDRFPLPGVIREMVKPEEITDEQKAVEAAARIVTAIAKFGWSNPVEAKKYVGDLGWVVVEKQGGWELVCGSLLESQVKTFQAQARELAKVQLQLAKLGKLDSPPSLPTRQETNFIARLGGVSEIIKKI